MIPGPLPETGGNSPAEQGTVRIPARLKGRIGVEEDLLRAFCVRNRISELAFFGSVLRDDFGPESDIDVLFRRGPGFSDRKRGQMFVDHNRELGEELGQMLGRRVDMVSAEAVEAPHSISRRPARHILSTMVVVYGDGRSAEDRITRRGLPPPAGTSPRNSRSRQGGPAMPINRHETALEDMLVWSGHAQEFLGDLNVPQLEANLEKRTAVAGALSYVGEASKKVDREFKDRHSEIPWADIAGMRDRLVHDYANIDAKKVHDTVREKLPPLMAFLANHVTEPPATSAVEKAEKSGNDPFSVPDPLKPPSPWDT